MKLAEQIEDFMDNVDIKYLNLWTDAEISEDQLETVIEWWYEALPSPLKDMAERQTQLAQSKLAHSWILRNVKEYRYDLERMLCASVEADPENYLGTGEPEYEKD